MKYSEMEQCVAVKNKKSTEQCPNLKKSGLQYCGVHARSKNVIHYSTSTSTPSLPPPPSLPPSPSKIKKVIHIIKKGCGCEMCNNFVSTKLALAQAVVRGWIVRRRTNCVNQDDVFTFTPLGEIRDLFTYVEQGHRYGFDARTFKEILNSSPTPLNPYSRQPIPPNAIKVFLKRGVLEEAELPVVLTKEQLLNDQCLKLFQKIDMLDNYTDYRWFLSLSGGQLRKFYYVIQDIWLYRAGLSLLQKSRMIDVSVPIFNFPKDFIKSLDKHKLRQVIIRDIDRLISEGVNENEKKLGAMYILTTLVEVSPEAATALPHYVQ